MEENREQPITTPALALNGANENILENDVVGEIGSQQTDALGKFKSVQALMDAYNSLQAEFTKKCQLLSELKKDKTDSPLDDGVAVTQNQPVVSEEAMGQFLLQNREAEGFAEEIKQMVDSANHNTTNPYEVAWAKVLLGHLKEGEKSDQVINQYVLSNENVKNKIIENYLQELSKSKPPYVMSSQGGERVSGVVPDAPKTLVDAKKLVDKMFS